MKRTNRYIQLLGHSILGLLLKTSHQPLQKAHPVDIKQRSFSTLNKLYS